MHLSTRSAGLLAVTVFLVLGDRFRSSGETNGSFIMRYVIVLFASIVFVTMPITQPIAADNPSEDESAKTERINEITCGDQIVVELMGEPANKIMEMLGRPASKSIVYLPILCTVEKYDADGSIELWGNKLFRKAQTPNNDDERFDRLVSISVKSNISQLKEFPNVGLDSNLDSTAKVLASQDHPAIKSETQRIRLWNMQGLKIRSWEPVLEKTN